MNVHKMVQEVCEFQGWSYNHDIEVPLGDGRHQLVVVTPMVHEGAPGVHFHSVLGSASELNATRAQAALSLNFSLHLGALAVHEDELVMVETMLLTGDDGEAVTAAVKCIAETADRYEKLIFGGDEH